MMETEIERWWKRLGCMRNPGIHTGEEAAMASEIADLRAALPARIDARTRPPEPGLIVKGWNSGAVWAGHFDGSVKSASCDWWMPIPG